MVQCKPIKRSSKHPSITYLTIDARLPRATPLPSSLVMTALPSLTTSLLAYFNWDLSVNVLCFRSALTRLQLYSSIYLFNNRRESPQSQSIAILPRDDSTAKLDDQSPGVLQLRPVGECPLFSFRTRQVTLVHVQGLKQKKFFLIYACRYTATIRLPLGSIDTVFCYIA